MRVSEVQILLSPAARPIFAQLPFGDANKKT